MENAVEALMMAGSILLFIIALTVTMSSFTTLRGGIDELLGQTETIELAKDSEGYINYMESKAEGSVRKVGIETLVTSITRGMKENYVAYIKLKQAEMNDLDANTDVGIITTSQNVNIAGSSQPIISAGDKLIKVTIGYDTNQDINTKLGTGLYNTLKDKTFYEYLGEYQEYNPSVPDAEKVRHRIITYIDTECFSTP